MTDGPLAVILAAGQGTRMRSALPKVLHPLGGRAMLLHVVATATEATGRPPVVIIGPTQDTVREALAGLAETAIQPQQRGTGDAARSVPPALRSEGPVLVLYGDVPLLTVPTLTHLLDAQQQSGASCVLLTTPAIAGMGRVVRGADGRVERIVEERDLPPGGPEHPEGNAGVYAFHGARLWPVLERLTTANAQGEYYLTDAIALLAPDVVAVAATAPDELLGVNDRVQLAQAEALLRRRTLERMMRSGVTLVDPDTTYIDATVRIGQDTVIHPMSVLRGACELGSGCEIGPFAQLRDVRAGDRVRIGASMLEECDLGDGVRIGQYDRIRPQTRLAAGVTLGTHAEVKNSTVGAGTTISHFSCVLDSDVGESVNVAAGTVTCNYDGVRKSRTQIGDRAFIGSDTMLVAPVSIGDDAYVAAGSVITRDVPAGALAVERAETRMVEGWTERHRARSATRARGA